MDNIREQNDELLSFDQLTPKWLSVAFKSYSGLALITGIFGIAMILVLSNFESSIFLISVSLIILGTALSSFILAYGCWKLKRWVIPILALTAISGLLYFFQDSSIQLISSSIISIIFFVIAIYYRSYFTGLYRSHAMQGLYILGLILIIAANILPIFTGSLNGTKAEFQTAYSLHDIRQYSLGLELYYSDNNQYPENLNILENSGYVFPQAIDSISNINRKIDYCISENKIDYAIGAPVIDSFGGAMEDSADQIDLPCILNIDKICAENGYYCEIPDITTNYESSRIKVLPLSSSDPIVTADIKELGMTFEYPSWWGDLKYRIGPDPIEFDYEGSRLDIWFSNYDGSILTGLSADYFSTDYNSISNFSGFGSIGEFTFFTSTSCEGTAYNSEYEDNNIMFKNILGCEHVNIGENFNKKGLDYYATVNMANYPNEDFIPGFYRIVEFNMPNNAYNIGGLRLVLYLDTLIEELKLAVEKPESLIENKEKMLKFYQEIVYGLELGVADKALLKLNEEFTNLVSSIDFR